MGLSREEQQEMASQAMPRPEGSAQDAAPQESFQIAFHSADGSRKFTVSAREGQTLMEVAKAQGVPQIEGICGGVVEVS